MRYGDFGNTGVRVSVLGFGAMRLPEENLNGKYRVKEEESIEIMQRAFDLGVNYIDTAYMYCHDQSELAVGKALADWRDRVYLSTKAPTPRLKKRGDYRRFMEEQLRKLNVDHVDFYHFHGLNEYLFENTVLKYDLLSEAQKAKDEGLVGHISFSFHDKPAVMKRIIDVGIFESVLCQYNILDRSNQEAMAYARRKGLGVAVMGPVGGGRLAPSDVLKGLLTGNVESTPAQALRFVLANKDVSIALSGMENRRMVEENTKVASSSEPLTREELRSIESFLEERNKNKEIPCNTCGYCEPCPNNVAISEIFEFMNQYTVYGVREYAREEYQWIGSTDHDERRQADACTECGECEEQCPQKIKIIDKLKDVHKILG